MAGRPRPPEDFQNPAVKPAKGRLSY